MKDRKGKAARKEANLKIVGRDETQALQRALPIKGNCYCRYWN